MYVRYLYDIGRDYSFVRLERLNCECRAAQGRSEIFQILWCRLLPNPNYPLYFHPQLGVNLGHPDALDLPFPYKSEVSQL